MIQYDAAHPGEIVREWMGESMGEVQLAERLNVSCTTLEGLLGGVENVTARLALKLAQTFPTTRPEFWLQLQVNYNLSRAMRDKRGHTATPRTS